MDSPFLSYIDVATFNIYVVKPDGFDLRRIHVARSEGLDDVDRERLTTCALVKMGSGCCLRLTWVG